MAGLHLESGTVIDLRGQRFTCGGRGPGGGFTLVPSKGRGNRVLKPEAAYDAFQRNELTVVEGFEDPDPPLMPSGHFDLSALPEKQRDEVLWRHYNMKRLDEYRSKGGTLSSRP